MVHRTGSKCRQTKACISQRVAASDQKLKVSKTTSWPGLKYLRDEQTWTLEVSVLGMLGQVCLEKKLMKKLERCVS